jgi:hypothetical protein
LAGALSDLLAKVDLFSDLTSRQSRDCGSDERLFLPGWPSIADYVRIAGHCLESAPVVGWTCAKRLGRSISKRSFTLLFVPLHHLSVLAVVPVHRFRQL